MNEHKTENFCPLTANAHKNEPYDVTKAIVRLTGAELCKSRLFIVLPIA